MKKRKYVIWNGTKDELISKLRDDLVRIGKTDHMSYNLYRSEGMPYHSTVKKILEVDTWEDVLLILGLKPVRRFWTREKLISEFSRIVKECGRRPTVKELMIDYGISHPLIRYYFGSYKNLCDLVGVDYDYHTTVKESDEELLKMYIDFSERLGKPAGIKELNESKDIYGFEVFRSRFGSITELKLRAGYGAVVDMRRVTKEECLKYMIDVYMKYGRLSLSKLEKSRLLPFSVKTLLRRFGTNKISEVWGIVEKEVYKRYGMSDSQFLSG